MTDYLKTEDFARRPLAWLDLISRNQGTTLSYSPTSVTITCSRRVSSQTHVGERFDLSRWRVAGNGADMIRPDVMQSFVDRFAEAGFKAAAFLPSYGLAESTLAVTLDAAGRRHPRRTGRGRTPPGTPRDLSRRATAPSSTAVSSCAGWRSRSGAKAAAPLADHHIGKVWCRGSSVMHSITAIPKPPPTAWWMAGSIPATWATWSMATCSSSTAPRT
ncbi:MAG: AMP-binding protein [Xanthobacteraceae bacterium]